MKVVWGNKRYKVKNINMSVIIVLLILTLLFLFVSASRDNIKASVITLNENQAQSWQVNVLDVGQGLAIIIQKDGHAILYDTGAAYPSGFNLVDAVIIPYLEFHGISKLDKVIISHSDNDHAGGLLVLKEQINIEEFIINEDLLRETSNQYCLMGQHFIWQGLKFEQLWPTDKKGKANDDSCVIRISDDFHSVLLTGDISKKVEKKLIAISQLSSNDNAQDYSTLKSDVLVAAHHGSKTSSSIEFIKQVAPETVIFSAGFLNRWQMPNKEVLQRYSEAQIQTFSTNNQGMIRIEVLPKEINVHTYRRDLMPYWFAN